MKTSKILLKSILILSIFSMITLTGCSKEDCYSCDPNVDSWVKENSKELLKMDRNQLAELSISKQKASLRMFSPERRRSIWIDKFNQVKDLSLSNGEKAYLKILEKTLLDIDFSKSLPLETENFLLKWVIEVKERFSWSNDFIAKSFFKIGNVNISDVTKINDIAQKDTGIKAISKIKKSMQANSEEDCDCRYNIGCGLQNYNCEDSSCDETDDGCGFFGTSSCTGKCN